MAFICYIKLSNDYIVFRSPVLLKKTHSTIVYYVSEALYYIYIYHFIYHFNFISIKLDKIHK